MKVSVVRLLRWTIGALAKFPSPLVGAGEGIYHQDMEYPLRTRIRFGLDC